MTKNKAKQSVCFYLLETAFLHLTWERSTRNGVVRCWHIKEHRKGNTSQKYVGLRHWLADVPTVLNPAEQPRLSAHLGSLLRQKHPERNPAHRGTSDPGAPSPRTGVREGPGGPLNADY